MESFNRTVLASRRSLTRLAIFSLLLAPLVVSAQGAGSESGDAIEEVVETGIRASPEAASDLKRNDARIVDAVENGCPATPEKIIFLFLVNQAVTGIKKS